ncbi:MAG: DUF447 family protein [Archaeoglobaceae archaeon]|nr:DUF447 family protein [Archaeoglobaceae archaeon]MCX8151835.1 DUF447 family protein [Archaeoglobaceae archaeon]MDW8014333.1 DUF447 family protein [Archaeoglobaceae archaeon]
MLRELGFTDGINEVIAVTFKKDGSINTAPIGIILEGDKTYARIYRSHTRENVERDKILYVNVILDPIVFALSTFEDLDESYFESLNPPKIKGTLSWCKFKAEIEGLIVHLHFLEGEIVRKYLRAYNRGFSALIEALILATRYTDEKFDEMMKYKNVVMRCGSEMEKRAFKVIEEKLGINF